MERTADQGGSGEQVVLSTGPSRFYFLGRYAIFIFLISLSLISVFLGPDLVARLSFEVPQPMFFSPFIMVFIALVWAEIPIQTIKYTLTDSKIIEERGVLSKSYESVSYSQITDTILEIKFRERFFGLGDIRINTAGAEDYEIMLKGVKNPEEVQELIENQLREGMELSDESIHKLAQEIGKSSRNSFQRINELRDELEEIEEEKWELREEFDNYELDERQFDSEMNQLERREEEIRQKLRELENRVRENI